MYKKIEKNFEEKIQLPTLEDRKKILSEKRNFYKPINKEEIDEFEKEY